MNAQGDELQRRVQRVDARGCLLVAVGAIVTAAGIGLLPHLLAGATTASSLAAAVFVAGGLWAVVGGGRRALRRGTTGRRIAGLVAIVVFVASTVWLIAPAVAATHVPATELTATPTDLDMTYESVTLPTSDGVELAAWYVVGSNRAGLVVLHGAGSTRSNVLDEAAVLAQDGYSVLLVDSRGHGESGGSAMDLGWYGDQDVIAAVDFLAARPEIDPTRIGVVGFSMGGEEAIGAAAADARIRAVIAEGATGRQADDKDWYSDVYGWRGWFQEQFERLQSTVVDVLTPASPPTSLRDAVATSAAHVLLITAGDVADEQHAAAVVRSAAPERVGVWNVVDAGHTDGYDTAPAEWEAHVVDFLDEHLGSTRYGPSTLSARR